jgi:hypothetical protein
MVLYLCVLIVFSLHRESLKLILVDEPLPEVVLSQISCPPRRPTACGCQPDALSLWFGRFFLVWLPSLPLEELLPLWAHML